MNILRQLFALSLACLSFQALGDDGWKLDKEGNGIKLFVRDEPGYNLKAFKGTMRIKASLDSAVALIADVEAFPQWYSDCSESRLLKKNSNSDIFTYFVNDSPFPVMDRDSIIHTVITQDPATKAVTFHMKGEPKFIPEKDDYVRVPKMEGFWVFSPVGDGELDVVFEMHSDAGGSVPAVLANQQVTVGPMKTMKQARVMLEKPRYRNATVDFQSATVTYGK